MINFEKWHGNGNDFVLINSIENPLKITETFIQKISKLSPLIPDNNDFQNLGDELSGNRFMCSESFRSLVTSIRSVSYTHLTLPTTIAV